MRLIDADSLKAKIMGEPPEARYPVWYAAMIDAEPDAQLERKKGKWILVKGSNGKDYHKCSECLHTQDITGVKNYCAVCGADMGGEQDEKTD